MALLAYVEMTAEHEQVLTEIRRTIRDRTRAATCVGFGPRFLHSTGQAYKGGPNSGVFVQITCDDAADLPVPGQRYTFGVVKAAQARGDFQVLAERGRRALRIHIGEDVGAGLAAIRKAVERALPQVEGGRKVMQLGMVGLGRMGANIVRRLMDGGHECVVFDVNAEAVKALEQEGATGSASLDDFVAKLRKPRAAWVMVPASFAGDTVDELAARMEQGDTVIDGGNSYYRDDIDRAEALEPKGIHYVDVGTSGGVFGLERGFCLMIGGEQEPVERLDPIFKTIAPGVEGASRTPGRSGEPSAAEQGYLHCGPAGAGHFVKMVHNGIEYGLMAAYAEGFNVLRHANVGKQDGRVEDAETAPLRDPRYYQYDIDVAAGRRGLAARKRGRVVAARPDRRRAGGVARPRGVHGQGVGLRRGTLDRARRGRRGRAGKRADDGALRALQLARRGRLRRPAPVGDAQAVRRPRRAKPGG